MRNNDTIKAYQQKMMDALKANDSEAYVQAMEEMMQDVAKETAARFEQMQDEDSAWDDPANGQIVWDSPDEREMERFIRLPVIALYSQSISSSSSSPAINRFILR